MPHKPTNQFRLSLERLVQNVPGMVAVYNVKTGKYVYVNDVAKKILGYAPQDFMTKGFEFIVSLVHPDDLGPLMAKNQQALDKANRIKPSSRDKEPIVNFEYRMRHKSGHYVWLHTDGSIYDRDDRGKIEHVLNISIDITKRKEVEENLRQLTKRLEDQAKKSKAESENRYQAFIHNSSEGIWRFEVDEPIPTKLKPAEQIKLMYKRAYLAEANMAMAEMYGFDSVKAMIGLRLADVHVQGDPANIAYLTAFIQAGYKLSGVESHEMDRFGNHKYFRNSLVGIIEDEHLVRAWGTQQDITEQHNAIEALRKSEELKAANTLLKDQRTQLMALNRSKDEFISLASHQLRTPATGVKQYLGMLLEGYGGPLSDHQMQMLKTAYDSNERQLTIIDDLLRVAHVDAGKVRLHKQKTELVRLLKDVITEQHDTFQERNQRVFLEHDKARVFAEIDKARMRMVFENLIDNASKYSPHDTEITVYVEATPKEVMVRVQDQGVGIARKDLENLFQKFSRVRNPLSAFVGGTGIGLYWAKKIVNLHKGTIEVESRLHKGTTFAVSFPKGLKQKKRAS